MTVLNLNHFGMDLFFVKSHLTRQTVVATKALTQVMAHAVKIAFWGWPLLAVLTAIEIALPELLDNGRIYGPILMVLMLIKFLMVAGFFMHLRYESKVLSRVFYGGAIAAVIVYTAVLSVFVFWVDSGIPEFNDPPPPQTTVPLDAALTPGG